MSGLNPGFTTGNALDAGASSATKHTDLADGIYEDVSSDMKSKQQGSIFSGMSNKLPSADDAKATGGGMLDSFSGSTGAMGHDAHHPSTLLPQSSNAPSKSASDMTGGLFSSNTSAGTQRTADSASQGLQDFKDKAGQYFEDAQNKAGDVGSSIQKHADDASSSTTTSLPTMGHDAHHPVTSSNISGNSGSGSGGILGAISEKVGSVFNTQSNQQASTFDAGMSSATKSTDLSDGIHEDASKGIESVQGATARKS